MKFMQRIFLICTLIIVFSLSGCGGSPGGIVENPQIDGITGPNVALLNGSVIVSMIFHNITIDAGATIPIPRYPNSSFQLGPDFQTGGMLLALTLSIVDFLGNQGVGLDPKTLPGGRPLPGVAAGALPAIAVLIPVLRQSILYIGPSVIGLFVPFGKIDLEGIILTFRFFDTNKNPVGNLSLVGADGRGENSGLLALMSPGLLGIFGEEKRIATLKEYIKMGYR